ncbi:Uncharacterised protein [Serratia liquefaciens]|nr:Uncharacterised protein [Serratia liquefaciens]
MTRYQHLVLRTYRGAANAIYRAWRAARFEVVTSRTQLDEIRRANRYPKLQTILQRVIVLEWLVIEVEVDDLDAPFCGQCELLDNQWIQ